MFAFSEPSQFSRGIKAAPSDQDWASLCGDYDGWNAFPKQRFMAYPMRAREHNWAWEPYSKMPGDKLGLKQQTGAGNIFYGWIHKLEYSER